MLCVLDASALLSCGTCRRIVVVFSGFRFYYFGLGWAVLIAVGKGGDGCYYYYYYYYYLLFSLILSRDDEPV